MTRLEEIARGREVKYAKRYRPGQLLGTLTRHFMLLTATPHNGKEADFQLFMALLDGDRADLRYVRKPFTREPDFGATSVNDELAALLAVSQEPA